jgi:hypothetical protein
MTRWTLPVVSPVDTIEPHEEAASDDDGFEILLEFVERVRDEAYAKGYAQGQYDADNHLRKQIVRKVVRPNHCPTCGAFPVTIERNV